MIENVDDIKLNDAGYKFDVELQETVKTIDASQLENDESKKLFKEFNEKATKIKEEEELKLPNPLTPRKIVDPVIKSTESALKELKTITDQVLNDMDRLGSKENNSFAKVAEIRPDVFLTSKTPIADEEYKADEIKTEEIEEPKEEELSTINEESHKSSKVISSSKGSERKIPRTVIKATPKKGIAPKREPIQKPITVKEILRYQRDVRKGIIPFAKSNGFMQKAKADLMKQSSKSKNKYELARMIDSSINFKV